MKRGLFFSRSSGPAGPRGRRAYAIGDIHGCLGLLENLLARIEREIDANPRPKTSIVFLGDVVDRGPESAGVIERLRTYSNPHASAHFIMGNHEEVMLRVIDGETDLLQSWLRFGGADTLKSYGVEQPRELLKMEGEEVTAILRSAIPETHRNFVRTFADSISFGDYVFVHAGIRPGVPLDEQRVEDLRWIRSGFLGHDGDHGKIIVHGHTVTRTVDERSNRIGIDTGAYATGVLTALIIDGNERRHFDTREPAATAVTAVH